MANLTEDEIGKIVRKARMFQKIYGNISNHSLTSFESEYPTVYEITDSLNIDRTFVSEAILEFRGVPVEEPFILDAGFNKAEILGFAVGDIDTETLKELKAEIEYHFNTTGKIVHRKNKYIWKAEPKGLAKIFASRNSIQVEIDQTNSAIRISAKQSMKTINKFYAPTGLGIFVAIAMISNSMFANGGEETLFGAAVIAFVTFVFSKFIKSRKQKKKTKLVELVERLQQIVERRNTIFTTKTGRISMPEEELSDIELEINPSIKTKSS